LTSDIIFFVRLSNKIAGLDVAPIRQMGRTTVEEVRITLTITTSYFPVRMIKPGL